MVGINSFNWNSSAKLNYAICIDEVIDLVSQSYVDYVLSTDIPEDDPDGVPAVTAPDKSDEKNDFAPTLIIIIAVVVVAVAVVVVVMMRKNKGQVSAVPVAAAPVIPVIICEKGLFRGARSLLVQALSLAEILRDAAFVKAYREFIVRYARQKTDMRSSTAVLPTVLL